MSKVSWDHHSPVDNLIHGKRDIARKVAVDSAKDIAVDVVSRLQAGRSMTDAFNEIGYGHLWQHTHATDATAGVHTVATMTRTIQNAFKRGGYVHQKPVSIWKLGAENKEMLTVAAQRRMAQSSYQKGKRGGVFRKTKSGTKSYKKR